MRRFGLYGETCREFLTYLGRVLEHDDAAELEFLVPGAVKGGVQVREIPPDFVPDQRYPIREHPGFSWVRWPLSREQFTRS